MRDFHIHCVTRTVIKIDINVLHIKGSNCRTHSWELTVIVLIVAHDFFSDVLATHVANKFDEISVWNINVRQIRGYLNVSY
jgi:hypothetical protein